MEEYVEGDYFEDTMQFIPSNNSIITEIPSNQPKEISDELKEKITREFAEVINGNSLENYTNTPDFILAEYLVNVLIAQCDLHQTRERWYGK